MPVVQKPLPGFSYPAVIAKFTSLCLICRKDVVRGDEVALYTPRRWGHYSCVERVLLWAQEMDFDHWAALACVAHLRNDVVAVEVRSNTAAVVRFADNTSSFGFYRAALSEFEWKEPEIDPSTKGKGARGDHKPMALA